jgi:hypothetical protein
MKRSGQPYAAALVHHKRPRVPFEEGAGRAWEPVWTFWKIKKFEPRIVRSVCVVAVPTAASELTLWSQLACRFSSSSLVCPCCAQVSYSHTLLVFCPCQVSHPRGRSKVTVMSVINSCLEVSVQLVTSVHCTSNRMLGTGKGLLASDLVLNTSDRGAGLCDCLKNCEPDLPNWQLPYIFPKFCGRRFECVTIPAVLRPVQSQNLKLRICVWLCVWLFMNFCS